MKAVILGASGILGQHMRACVPIGVEPLWFRRQADALHMGFDLDRPDVELDALLSRLSPDLVINLAGENRVDVVEKDPEAFHRINVDLPMTLASWCHRSGAHYLHISTNGVFSGNEAPYGPGSPRNPVNRYGRQKMIAEDLVMKFDRWTIARLTFIVGVRLIDACRRNPAEDMLEKPRQIQTMDRWFSPCFAGDAASVLWRLAAGPATGEIFHIGLPFTTSRHQIAAHLNSLNGEVNEIEAVDSSRFPEIAPRPIDTTWAEGALPAASGSAHQAFVNGLSRCYQEWIDKKNGARGLPETQEKSVSKRTA